jgi:redox-sensitive bicupin YhaK (pirin superfamily)
MVEPQYQELLSKDIPNVEKDGVTAIIIAGKAFDTKVCFTRGTSLTFWLSCCIRLAFITLPLPFRAPVARLHAYADDVPSL